MLAAELADAVNPGLITVVIERVPDNQHIAVVVDTLDRHIVTVRGGIVVHPVHPVRGECTGTATVLVGTRIAGVGRTCIATRVECLAVLSDADTVSGAAVCQRLRGYQTAVVA